MRTTWIVLAMMVACGAWAADSQQSKPQNKSSKLVTENGSPKPGPTINFLTAEQISEAIASGIETADEKRVTEEGLCRDDQRPLQVRVIEDQRQPVAHGPLL